MFLRITPTIRREIVRLQTHRPQRLPEVTPPHAPRPGPAPVPEQPVAAVPAQWLTVAEAARTRFGGKVSLRSWYRAAETGEVPCVKIGGKILFRAADLDRLEASTFSPAAPTRRQPVQPPQRQPPRKLPPPSRFRFFPPS